MIAILIPPVSKGGLGGILKLPEIPLNPPFSKGDFKYPDSMGSEFPFKNSFSIVF
jgi:hypothetical protein